MELACSQVKTGIWLTHAGDPLANGHKGFSHCVSDHRFVLAAFASVAQGTDKQAAVAEFQVAQVFSEGAGDALLVAERDPVSEGRGLGVAVLRGVGSVGLLVNTIKLSLDYKTR